jgi:hypothetical protein
MQQIHHKKNELLEIEFYQDKECTEAFESKSHLYYLHNADCEAILKCVQELEGIFIIPYISKTQMPILSSAIRIERLEHNSNSHFWTLSDTKEYNKRHFQTLLPNLSKYIPEDNAVLFLSQEDCNKYSDYFKNIRSLYASTGCYNSFEIFDKYKKCILTNNTWLGLNKKITIVLPHGTQSELQKANEVAKELKEKYGREEVNLFVLHCFQYIGSSIFLYFYPYLNEEDCYINKITTTNSTGILPVDDKDRLQVIDCKEIFEEYLQNER